MKDIEYYNHKYNSLDALTTSKGDLNSALVRRDWFNKTKIYSKILEDTKYLDIFDSMTFADRFTILHDNIELKYCRVCKQPHIYVPKSQHSYKLCNHKFNMNVDKLSATQKKISSDKKNNFIKSLENKELFLNDVVFKEFLKEYNNKPNNYGFILTDNNLNFFHDLVLKTINILEFDRSDFKFSERIYILVNKLNIIPTCLYCNKKTYFNNRKTGYCSTCRNHSHIINTENRILKNKIEIDNVFNFEKYSIVKYPDILTHNYLVVQCKNCGMISEWKLVNGRIKTLEHKKLCRHCEESQSKKEESLFDMISTIYKGEIIHHNGGRKVIPPYELDFYIPEKKLAIEFDGIYWHSEISGGKNASYHLSKTNMCEKNGIQLIHIFENEYIRKYDIVKSRLKNLFGVYDKTIYARKCVVRIVDPKTSSVFMEENHLQGYVKSKIHIGLFYDNELVSMMSFRKPRMNANYEWELMRFCNKLGYHVIGGASKLLKYFEINMKPKSIISYADRRWSVGNLYKALGFSFQYNSRPNYWYFKTNNVHNLLNRINFQKFKQKNILKSFNDNLTEVENMRNNGYDRIFDCGNMVFVKIYKKDSE